MAEFKKLENKAGINETRRHDRALTGGMTLSKILEVSFLIVSNLLFKARLCSAKQALSAFPGGHLQDNTQDQK